jgi:DNA-binding response OmpR family regulator
VGDLVVDPAARQVRVGDRPVELRAKEFDLLVRLAVEAGVVVRREAIMADVWKASGPVGTKTLDVHIAALRRRVDLGPGPSRISTVRGIGYRLERPG